MRPTLNVLVERLPYQLIEFYQRRAAASEPMALITVLETEGSTYSKAGSQMLVDGVGDFQGMLSGGCLEGDLAERAKNTMASGAATTFTYDLRSDDDVFGLGVGCEGVIHILIQPLDPKSQYTPLAELIDTLSSEPFADLVLDDGRSEARVTRVLAPLKLLILGAGLDADPLALFAKELGWNVTVSDHRPAAAERMAASNAVRIDCVAVDELSTRFDLDTFDAAVIMSHNLTVDRSYLSTIAGFDVPFVGLLGPPHRRDRLLREIGAVADSLEGRLRAPVGRQVGGRGPAAIALEIVAELQARFGSID